MATVRVTMVIPRLKVQKRRRVPVLIRFLRGKRPLSCESESYSFSRRLPAHLTRCTLVLGL